MIRARHLAWGLHPPPPPPCKTISSCVDCMLEPPPGMQEQGGAGILGPGTGNLFVTKRVHIKRYGLKLGPDFSKSHSASFPFSEIQEINKTRPQNPGTCFLKKQRAPARHARVVVRIGFNRKTSVLLLHAVLGPPPPLCKVK